MIRRTFSLEEKSGSGGRSFLTEAGDYFIQEKKEGELTGQLGRFSYLAATVLAAELEGAVTDFIEDNRQTCSSCGAEWILLKSNVDVPKCPDCGLITQCNQD